MAPRESFAKNKSRVLFEWRFQTQLGLQSSAKSVWHAKVARSENVIHIRVHKRSTCGFSSPALRDWFSRTTGKSSVLSEVLTANGLKTSQDPNQIMGYSDSYVPSSALTCRVNHIDEIAARRNDYILVQYPCPVLVSSYCAHRSMQLTCNICLLDRKFG